MHKYAQNTGSTDNFDTGLYSCYEESRMMHTLIIHHHPPSRFSKRLWEQAGIVPKHSDFYSRQLKFGKTTSNDHQWSSMIINDHQWSSLIIIDHHHSSFIIIIIIHHSSFIIHHSSFIIIIHHSSFIIHHSSFTIIITIIFIFILNHHHHHLRFFSQLFASPEVSNFHVAQDYARRGCQSPFGGLGLVMSDGLPPWDTKNDKQQILSNMENVIRLHHIWFRFWWWILMHVDGYWWMLMDDIMILKTLKLIEIRKALFLTFLWPVLPRRLDDVWSLTD